MYIYAADVYCDGCGEDIKDRLLPDVDGGFDPDDETTYDSDVFPKGPYDVEESDVPNHCAGCGIFLENPLTTDGDDYVRDAVREDLMRGCTDSVAVTEWMPFYDYIAYFDCADDDDWDAGDECVVPVAYF